MTHRGRNVNAKVSTSFDVRGIVRVTLFALLALTLAANARAENKMAAPFAHVGDDLILASHIRSALRKDERLQPFIPHVSVSDGIAHLSGPIPSAEWKKHAVEIASRVPGVVKVEAGDLYVAKASRRPVPLSLPLEGEKPTQTKSASPTSLSAALEETLIARDSPPSPPLPPPPSPQRVTLLAPEAVAGSSRLAEPARLTANPRTPSPAASLPAALERLRRSDTHFRTIRTEVQGTTVRVFTGDTAGEHVMAFARTIRRLPGVQRVVIQDTSARSR